MGKQVVDISQIQKYLNGELDAQAMHRLERQALDDPFLADALEGYRLAGTNNKANLANLSARLKQRTEKREVRVIPFRYLSAAASVLVICSFGVWWYLRVHPQESQKPVNSPIARISKTPVANDTTTERGAPPAAEQATAQAKQYAADQAAAGRESVAGARKMKANEIATVDAGRSATEKPNDVLQKIPAVKVDRSGNLVDTTPLNEAIVMNYKSNKSNSARPADTSIFVRRTQATPIRLSKRDSGTQQRLIAQAPGVKIYGNNSSQSDLDKAIEQGQFKGLANDQLRTNPVITGKVISLYNGLPVKGASVKVLGSNQVARTDAKGYFNVQADTTKNKLVVTGQGFRTRLVSANSRDSMKMIVLSPSDSDGADDDFDSNSGTKDEAVSYVSAHPEKGWSNYRNYLNTNAVSPDGKSGVVKVSFTVDKNGLIANIKVLKGLSDAANKKAISLIKDGPAWAGSTDKKLKAIVLKINFGK